MSQCPKCKINILDDAVMCPLCRSVLENNKETVSESKSVMYPDISLRIKRSILAIRISIFAAIVIEAICIMVNYLTYGLYEFRWSLLTGIGLLYGCISLVVSVRRTRSHRRKIVVQLGFWLLVLVGVDLSIGFNGWSIAFGFPISILMVLIGIAVLMIVKSEIWQTYIYPIIWLMVYSLITLLSAFVVKQVSFRLLDVISVLVVGTFLAGVIVIGERRAENELKRRFHV